LGVEEFSEVEFRIDPSGFLDMPLVGRVKAGGLTVPQLREQLVQALASEVREPRVSIDIVEFGSQPVSVMGAVRTPGVHQLRGQKTLAEILALAGGLREDAGARINIVRQKKWGPIPLSTAKMDSSGGFHVADIKLQDFLTASNPAENILIRPNDVITVPRADMVYVIGAVRKPGAFTLNEQESVSVLQALSMAEGLGVTPAPADSKILRMVPDGERTEIAVNVGKILSGTAKDVSLQPNDVLFVPSSTSKQVAKRALETVVSTLSGIAIFRR
jgi:polysaccharide export outer membrane protein